jgi:hypothetical protein
MVLQSFIWSLGGAQDKTIGGVYVSIAFRLRIQQGFYALRKL